MSSRTDIRDGFFDTVFDLAQKNSDLVFLSADADAHSLVKFRETFPNRYINVGVAEQNMITVAAGLALAGKRVFVYSLLPFLTMRCYEQIHFNIVGMNLPVSFVGVGAGYSFDFDGPSHHGVMDIGLFNLLSGFTILNPSDATTAELCAKLSYDNNGPTLTRLDKGSYEEIGFRTELTAGLRFIGENNSSIKIVVTGTVTHNVVCAVNNISKAGIKIDIIEVFKLKPLDHVKLNDLLREAKVIICVEENSQTGGLTSILKGVIVEYAHKVKLVTISLNDAQCFNSGVREVLLRGAGLSREQLENRILLEAKPLSPLESQ